jgi:hypothetical protein
MPLFGAAQSGPNAASGLNIAALYPSEGPYYLFNAESPAQVPQASVVIERGKSGTDDAGISFQIEYEAAPTAVVQILGSNDPNVLGAFNLAQWVVLFTSTNQQSDGYTDTARWRYYCAYVLSEAAGFPVTVAAQR